MSALMNFAFLVARLRSGGRLVIPLAAALAALILCANPAARAASVQPLEIATRSGVQVFSVEMATTEEEKTTGLMYRKELADGKGMLFDFSPEPDPNMLPMSTHALGAPAAASLTSNVGSTQSGRRSPSQATG